MRKKPTPAPKDVELPWDFQPRTELEKEDLGLSSATYWWGSTASEYRGLDVPIHRMKWKWYLKRCDLFKEVSHTVLQEKQHILWFLIRVFFKVWSTSHSYMVKKKQNGQLRGFMETPRLRAAQAVPQALGRANSSPLMWEKRPGAQASPWEPPVLTATFQAWLPETAGE